jgi:hypothetical protein
VRKMSNRNFISHTNHIYKGAQVKKEKRKPYLDKLSKNDKVTIVYLGFQSFKMLFLNHMCKQGYIMNKISLPTCKGCSLCHFKKTFTFLYFQIFQQDKITTSMKKGLAKPFLATLVASCISCP